MRRIILLLLLTVTITSTQAQSTDAEARRVVSEAFSALDEGYTFTRDGENTQTFYQDDEVVFTSYNSETSTGEVAANGDYHRSLTARSA